MITMEFFTVGLNTLFKAASLKGLSYYVFVAYTSIIAALLFLPFHLVFHRTIPLPQQKRPLFVRILLLGLIGFVGLVIGYKGIGFSSPTLAAAIGTLNPAFTFILAVMFRMERLSLRRSSSQAKIIGTVSSISGAIVVVLFKGPTILSTFSSPEELVAADGTSHSNYWLLGGLLIATAHLLFSLGYIVQAQVLRMYPAEFSVALSITMCTSAMSLAASFVGETDIDAWILTKPDIKLAAVLYGGFFGGFLNTIVHTWCLHMEGPVFVAIFKPLSIAIAAAMGVVFLGDDLHLGSVAGAMVISAGFYGVIWGKAREGKEEMELAAVEDCGSPYHLRTSSTNSNSLPFLVNHT
ncbi:unnamed protein product [Linum tenue]|uniref:WAT1-related protein n=1 Tax=Linum tenue TaxID=586396 RepID=A0AAV0KE31_9ROSI|nr:unnamed protein product [Linum tenue]